MWYTYDILGRFAGTSETQTPRSTEIAPPDLVPEWNWSGEKWVYARVPERPVMPPPPRNVDDVREELLEKVQAEKVKARDAGFMVADTLFDSDISARTSYTELGLLLSQNPSFTTQWKASAGQWVVMDAALYSQVVIAGEAHITAVFAWQAAKEMEIADCETVEELEAVVITYA